MTTEYPHQLDAIGPRIAMIRKVKRLTQTQLAAASGIKQSVISRLETGQSERPSLETTFMLCTALGISLDDLLMDMVGDFESFVRTLDPERATETVLTTELTAQEELNRLHGQRLAVERRRADGIDILETAPETLLGNIERWMEMGIPIFVTGGTASGKSSVLCALLDLVPHGHRTALFGNPYDIEVFEEMARSSDKSSATLVPKADDERTTYAKALQLRPDVIAFDEMRTGNQVQFLSESVSTGTAVLATMHSNSAGDAYRRLNAWLGTSKGQTWGAVPSPIFIQLIRGRAGEDEPGKRKIIRVAQVLPSVDPEAFVIHELYGLRDDNKIRFRAPAVGLPGVRVWLRQLRAAT